MMSLKNYLVYFVSSVYALDVYSVMLTCILNKHSKKALNKTYLKIKWCISSPLISKCKIKR